MSVNKASNLGASRDYSGQPASQQWQRFRTWVTSQSAIAIKVVSLSSLAVSSLVLGLNHFGLLENWELQTYDQMVRLRQTTHPMPMDDRILVVGISEDDLANLPYPIPDHDLAQAMATLQTHQPIAIGLDTFRNRPYGHGQAEFLQQLQQPNVIAITKLPNGDDPGIAPPKQLPPEQIGFNDIPEDADGRIRRFLLFGSPNSEETLYAFSLRLALKYLAQQSIKPKPSQQNPENLQLNQATFVPLSTFSGGYQTLDTRGYQALLDYRAATTAIQVVSLTDVLQNRVSADQIQGKLILIGYTAPSVKDRFHTPFSTRQDVHYKMPGVVLHAQITSQLLDNALGIRPLFWFFPNWGEVLWIMAWAYIGGTSVWLVRNNNTANTNRSIISGLILILIQGLSIAVLAGVAYGLFLWHGWVPIIAPAISCIGTSSAILAYRTQEAAQQRQMMLTLLGQNISSEVANALWENRDRLIKSGKLPGQKLVATMLFTDLQGFSTIAETTPPEELLDWLNEYLSAMVTAIQTHHGIINKFTGDGLLAAFGVPVARKHAEEIAADAQAAVRCALNMGERLGDLNQVWKDQGLPPLYMRVGIFTGEIVVGSLGSKDRMEYGLIGDSVNIASRLESFDKTRQSDHCRILIGQETLNHLNNCFEVESWGSLHLKGREHTVNVYRVIR